MTSVMEVSQDAESVVRSWLQTTPKKTQAKRSQLYTQISPRPDRLGLGAEFSAGGTGVKSHEKILNERIQRKLIGHGKRQRIRSDEDRAYATHATLSSKNGSYQCGSHLVFNVDSGSDEECSKSAAISESKTRPPTFSIDKLAGNSKRKRRRRKGKSKQIHVSGDGSKTAIHSEKQGCDNAQGVIREGSDDTTCERTSTLNKNHSTVNNFLTPTLIHDVLDEVSSVFPESVQSQLSNGALTPLDIIETMSKRSRSKTEQASRERSRSISPVTEKLSPQQIKSKQRVLRRRHRMQLTRIPQRRLVDRLFTSRQYWRVH